MKLCDQFSEYTDGYEIQFGYFTPGHRKKGKQEKIVTDEELAEMYKKTKRILLWLKCKPKAKASSDSDSSLSKRQSASHASLVNMMSEIDSIVESLKPKHGEKYTSVQLNCWVHMIHTHKH